MHLETLEVARSSLEAECLIFLKDGEKQLYNMVLCGGGRIDWFICVKMLKIQAATSFSHCLSLVNDEITKILEEN